MERKQQFRTKSIGIRVSEDEWTLFDIVARSQGITVSEFLRQSGIHYAEMSAENKDFLDSIGQNSEAAQNTVHEFLTDLKEVIFQSLKHTHDDLSVQVKRVEKLIDVFLYAYLFHQPEVKEVLKENAMKSAIRRKEKVLSMIEDEVL